jgi:DNA-binding NarL/FixJ family response regulator
MKRARIILADDHTLILEGLHNVVSPHYDVVESVRDGRSLVESTLRLKPDLVILDITMPLLNGLDAARQLRRALPRLKLLFVTMHANPTYLREALSAGGSGYVLKSSAREEILDAIEKVLNGETYVSRGIAGEDVGLLSRKHAFASSNLTSREREILQMIAEGRSSKEMAFVLSISAKTVAFHRDNIKAKLGLRSTAELTKFALQEGLI